MHMNEQPAVAAIAAMVHADGFAQADALLAGFAAALVQQGWRVGGLLHERRRLPSGRGGMFLVDVQTAEEYCISQDLGRDARGCSVSTAGLAQASAVLRRALAQPPDLVIVNRFGAQEAQGGGFAAEMLALAEAHIPFVTAVAHKHLDAWTHFCGAAAEHLPADAAALQAWWARSAPGAPGTGAGHG